MMQQGSVHISVCICTYRRPERLERLLDCIASQRVDASLSLVVVDNDREGSAEAAVEAFRRRSGLPVSYCLQPEKNVAVARNTAVRRAEGDFIAFIDDDEIPEDSWLDELLRAYRQFGVNGVLGPVLTTYAESAPAWLIRGRLLERPSIETGTVLHWSQTRTGNVLLERRIFDDDDNLFDPQFKHGEDVDFFRRMMGKGHRFVWCAEAAVVEEQMGERFRRRYFLRRAIVRGGGSLRHYQSSKLVPLLKSVVAVPAYSLFLPFALLAGQHVFMRYLVKDCDHIGRLLAACGLRLWEDV